MKNIIKQIIINVVAIALLAAVMPGVSYNDSVKTLIVTAIILGLVNLLIKPILKLIFLPINLITFGLAGWFIHAITIYLTSLLVDGFSIGQVVLGPITILGIHIPKLLFDGVWAYLVAGLGISLINNILLWVL